MVLEVMRSNGMLNAYITNELNQIYYFIQDHTPNAHSEIDCVRRSKYCYRSEFNN